MPARSAHTLKVLRGISDLAAKEHFSVSIGPAMSKDNDSTEPVEVLIDELSTPKRDYDQNGRVKVESKKDLAKREITSPNLADAFVMCYPPGARSLDIWAKLAG